MTSLLHQVLLFYQNQSSRPPIPKYLATAQIKDLGIANNIQLHINDCVYGNLFLVFGTSDDLLFDLMIGVHDLVQYKIIGTSSSLIFAGAEL